MCGCKRSFRPFFVSASIRSCEPSSDSLWKTASPYLSTRFSSTACSPSCGVNVEADVLWTSRDPPLRCMTRRKTDTRTRSLVRYTTYDSYTARRCADHHRPIAQHQVCVIGQTATVNKTKANPRGEHMGQRIHCVWREGEAQTKGAIDLTASLC